jgi:hypothetical protein
MDFKFFKCEHYTSFDFAVVLVRGSTVGIDKSEDNVYKML